MADELATIEMFSDKIGDAFVIEEPEVPPIPLTLVEASLLRNYAKAARPPFSLIFETHGAGGILMQRCYALRHPQLGLQQIFLVPIGGDGEAATYQAVFN